MDPQKLALHIATQLKLYREQAGMTQAQVAAKARVTVETVARVERVVRGRASSNANPSLETMARLCYAVGVDLMTLLQDAIVDTNKTDSLERVIRHMSPEARGVLAAMAEALVNHEHNQQKLGRPLFDVRPVVVMPGGQQLRGALAPLGIARVKKAVKKPAQKKPRRRK